MKREGRLVRALARSVALCAAVGLVGCPPLTEDLDAFIECQMERANLPGLAACIVKEGEIVWARGYGWADLEAAVPVEADTLFLAASVSKLVTGTALMQLCEDGLLNLDDDINGYLPFDVRNPFHPDAAITFRMLLTHTSSIKDNPRVYAMYTEGADSPIPLGDAVERYLRPGGEWYSAFGNFALRAPGTHWDYSSAGIALAGYLVEEIAVVPFDRYCNEFIFAPLGMNETSFRLSDLDESHIAVPYTAARAHSQPQPIGHLGHPGYPAGFMRTSVTQFARFLAVYMNGGELDGARVLGEETVDEMLTVQYPELNPDQALAWIYTERAGQDVPSHSGNYLGATTDAFLVPEEKIGIVVFANGGELPNRSVLPAIEERLLEEAQRY
ncbi:MAG TPA: beta-lactamase family protein [Candidatus Hydrogenedentes bacterium]|nr:beta-lactamase family protein [Candidatus Hydrogenedentota bacterium]